MSRPLLNATLFTRGPFAVMALLGLLSQVVDFSKFSAVRAIHALIVGWNGLMGTLADAIPIELPFEVDAVRINVFAIWLTLILPASIITANALVPSLKKIRERTRQRERELRENRKIIWMMIRYFWPGSILFYSPVVMGAFIVLFNASLFFLFSEILFFIGVNKFSLFGTIIVSLFSAIYILGSLIIGISENRPFRNGLVFIITSLITVEALYYSPVLGDYFDKFADSQLGPN